MPKKPAKPRPDAEDPNVAARRALDEILTRSEAREAPPSADVPPSEKNPAAVALGRMGGLKGGKARAAKLTPEQRAEIAKKAAKARWKGRP